MNVDMMDDEGNGGLNGTAVDEIDFMRLAPESLAEHLAQIDAQRAAVLEAMAAQRGMLHANLVSYVKEQVRVYNLDADAIAQAIAPATGEAKVKPPRKPREDRVPSVVRVLITDPSKRYSKGALPQWMIDSIRGAGLDPDNKEDREKFRSEYMQIAA